MSDTFKSKVIIVTGANRGIGKAICQSILDDPSLSPLSLYATSRKGTPFGLNPQNDTQTIHYSQLDISQPSSITTFAETVQQTGQPVDVLINNAGINLDYPRFSHENATKTIQTNYHGTLNMCKAFLPLIRPETGRIVSLSSVGSSLKTWDPETAKKVAAISSLPELDELIKYYLASVEAGNDVHAGFPSERSYSVSKAGVNLLTAILARENPGLTINCCCPGWIATEMGDLVSSRKVKPPKTPEQGALIPLHLAFGDVGGISGKYWANDSVRSKEKGRVQDWTETAKSRE